MLPLAALCALTERSLALRVLGAAACVPILGGILLTFSRGAALSVLLLLLVMVFLKYIKIRYALAGLLALVLVMAVAEPSYVHRISTLAGLSSGSITSADTSIRGRAAENLAAAQIFLENPFLGAGAGQAHLYIAHYANETGLKMIEGTRRGHNMYLEELADTGIVGFAFFVSIVALTIQPTFSALNGTSCSMKPVLPGSVARVNRMTLAPGFMYTMTSRVLPLLATSVTIRKG